VVNNITFNSGVNSTTFDVPITNDDIPENDETFEVFLKNIPDSPNNVIFADPSVAVGTIFDDEIPSKNTVHHHQFIKNVVHSPIRYWLLNEFNYSW